MLSVPGLDDIARRQLTRQRQRLVDATHLTPGQRRPYWTPNRLNARYVPALRLAERILDSSSFEFGRGSVTATGFLVSMPNIFENFLATSLTEALHDHGGRCVAQDQRWFLDNDRQVTLRPDFVWYPTAAADSPGIVVDAKYKAASPSGFPNADIYQILAYCSAMGLSTGHLVYAKGNADESAYRVPGTGPGGEDVTVIAHALDLDVSPEGLLEQVQELADALMQN